MPAKLDAGDDYERAAIAIWEADYLVVIAGPSFYEPSEKTAFANELCDPILVQTAPEKFFGFWGEYFNRYADRTPHEGYSILRKWRDNYFDAYGVDQRRKGNPAANKAKAEDADVEVLHRCYVVTATVDGSFGRSGFPGDELYELCGSIMSWQCWIPCKPEVWNIDSHFRFDIDPLLHEAKPIKWVADNRQAITPEVWTVVDNEVEPVEDDLPPLVQPVQDKAKKGTVADPPNVANDPLRRRLYHCTAINLHLMAQQVYPNMAQFVDHFSPAPESNHAPIPTYTFPVKPKKDAAEASEGVVKVAGPEQPYILAPRVNHCLNHLLALYTNKFSFHLGTFDYNTVLYRKLMRRHTWQNKQRFFDSSIPDIEAKRKLHIYYNVSIMILDATHPSECPALLAFEQAEEAAAEDGPTYLPPLSGRANSRLSIVDKADPSLAAAPSTTPWVQGKDGRYYFSYLPISSSYVDPDGVYFDTIQIEFPLDTLPDTLPLRGKISIIVECCEYPEPKPKEDKPPDKKEKKKKDDKEGPVLYPKLDPIPEPTVYTVCQMVGRFKKAGAKRNDLIGHTLPFKPVDSFNTGPEDFAYTMSSGKGHAVDIGCTYSSPLTIRFIEIEVPVPVPANRDPLKGPVVQQQTSTDSKPLQQSLKKKKKTPRPVPNWQRCPNCGESARPNVVMDLKKDIRVLTPPKKPYQTWENQVNKLLRTGGASVVILEMGCEKKVDVSRKLSEKLFKLTKTSGGCMFIRLSTENLEKKTKGNQADADKIINIVGPFLNSLSVIDRRMQDLKRRK